MHGLGREPWDEVKGVDEAAALLKLSLVKPLITRHQGLEKGKAWDPGW